MGWENPLKISVSELRLEPGTSWIWSMKPIHLTLRFSIKYLTKYLFSLGTVKEKLEVSYWFLNNLLSLFFQAEYTILWCKLCIAYSRPTQPTAHGQRVAYNTALCCLWRHLKQENVFRHFSWHSQEWMLKQFWNLWGIIYDDIYYTTQWFCKNVLKVTTP
jgi:hypothetical protein